MGYASSYCEICGGPTNTTISSFEDGDEFEVGPEHEWLGRVVGLLPERERSSVASEDGIDDPPSVLRGALDDHGELTTEDGLTVSAGWVGGYLAVHEDCWELAGRPIAEALASHGESDLSPYQQQYFEWGALGAAGEAWKLDPPLGQAPGSARNRARIESLAALVRARMAGQAPASLPPRAAAPSAPRVAERPAPPSRPVAPPEPIAPSHRRFEKTDGGTKKFWEIHVEGASFEIRYGDVGGAPRMPFTRECDGPREAAKQAEDLVKSRLADGFAEVPA